MYLTAVKLIFLANRIDYLDEEPTTMLPTILIFLPGMYEIHCMHRQIEETATKA